MRKSGKAGNDLTEMYPVAAKPVRRRKHRPVKEKIERPLPIKFFYAIYLAYLAVPVFFFVNYLSKTITPVLFGTLSMGFSFLLVSFLFVWYFGLWQMKKWGLYFAMLMSFIVLFDWSTRYMMSETVLEMRLSQPLVMAYHTMTLLLILTTFYVFRFHRRRFK